MLAAEVGSGLRTLDCRFGPETDDGDENDAFVRSLLAIIARSSFCNQAINHMFRYESESMF